MTAPTLTESILDSLKDAVFLVALDGEVVRYWNRGAEALYGWRAADVLGHSSDLLHTRFLGPVTPEQVRAALTERRCWRGEVHQRHRDGRRRRGHATPVSARRRRRAGRGRHRASGPRSAPAPARRKAARPAVRGGKAHR